MDGAEGKREDRGCILYAGLLTKTIEHVVDKDGAACFVVAILRAGERDRTGHDAGGTEAGIDLLQADEAGEEHAGACDQQERDSHLTRNQDGAQPLLAGAASAGADSVCEPQRPALGAERSTPGHAGADRGEQSDGGSGEDEAQVGMDGEAGGEVMRDGAQDQAAEQGSGEDAEDRGEAGEQQHLADEE